MKKKGASREREMAKRTKDEREWKNDEKRKKIVGY